MTALRGNGHLVGFRRQVRCQLAGQEKKWVPLSQRRPADLWTTGDVHTTEPIFRNGEQEPAWRD